MAEVLGLIAGEGVLPLLGARQARVDGRPLVCVALRERADPALAAHTDEILWIQPGEVVRGLAFLREHGVREVVLAGKVSKQPLLDGGEDAGQDAEARRLLAELPDLRDTTLLSRLADWLDSAGIELLPQWALAPDLRAGIGSLGGVAPDANQQRDLAFGLRCARRLAELDIGQTVVVKAGSVIAHGVFCRAV